ncbi:MAG TPA: glutamate-cysteine ligase family protein [Bdellovibrio sp.]|uniref:glutamate-cysteine ligase family protein n=1 Tax=Bdellovibrio sp. TaxID=28201 RepID=UPI002F1DC301
MTFSQFSSEEKKNLAKEFRFGLESEYLVVTKDDFTPLWHHDLTFETLNGIFESVPLDGIPSCEGLDLEPPQTKLMPFVVEGYHLPDMDFHAKEILPKGVEIRTPVCNSLEEVLKVHTTLFTRLRKAMNDGDYDLVCLSHHPIHSQFSGPQNKRRHDYWQWSMEVMTTFGPDINVSLSDKLAAMVSADDLEAKINYYGPALSALSVASPFVDGSPWALRDGFGKSFRMHKRSYIAPPIEFHPTEKNRYEFKVFDMPNSIEEIEAQFLSFLTLVLDEGLQGRASKQTRIYDLGQVARHGIKAEDMKARATELLERAPAILKDWGYNPQALEVFKKRILTGKTPADDMIELYQKTNSLTEVLKSRSQFLV